MLKGILGMFKGKDVQKVEVSNKVEIFRGKWDLGGTICVGAYIRRGNDKLFVTENGVIVLPKMHKKELIRATIDGYNWNLGGSNLYAVKIEKYLYDVLNCNCVPFITLAQA